ncbi:MAG: heat-inducible transcriptional repressor HrcA [Armatimonadota bacterium]
MAVKTMPIQPLDSRKQQILKAIVNDYVTTAEPVGSHMLAGRYSFGVQSATIRNEMAELSEMGYLHQPHTSAGRIPSDLGYRFYVDRLMDAAVLPAPEAERARRMLASRRAEVELLLEHTCRILADLARYTSIATQPKVKDAIIRHVSIANVAPGRVLAVVVLDNGRIVHEIIDSGSAGRAVDPISATNYLSRKLGGRAASSVIEVSSEPETEDPREMVDLARRVLRLVRHEAEAEEEADIHLGGTSYMMQQPEFKNPERLEAVLSVLDERKALYKLFASILSPQVTVLIGKENPLDAMSECSFVGAKYRIGGRVAGTIGVMGPTRMDYRRAVSAVEFMVRNLEDLLNGLAAM